MHQDYVALMEVHRLRNQIGKLKSAAPAGAPAMIQTLDEKAALLEGGSGSTFLNDAAGVSLVRLNSGLNQLLAAVDSADTAPTSQAAAMFNEVSRTLEKQLAAWNQIKTSELPALNQQLEHAKLAPITLTDR
jgi:hypothetical protein